MSFDPPLLNSFIVIIAGRQRSHFMAFTPEDRALCSGKLGEKKAFEVLRQLGVAVAHARATKKTSANELPDSLLLATQRGIWNDTAPVTFQRNHGAWVFDRISGAKHYNLYCFSLLLFDVYTQARCATEWRMAVVSCQLDTLESYWSKGERSLRPSFATLVARLAVPE